MTAGYLADLLALADAASPEWTPPSDDGWEPDAKRWYSVGVGDIPVATFQRREDALFAAAAREALPSLVAEVERLRDVSGYLERDLALARRYLEVTAAECDARVRKAEEDRDSALASSGDTILKSQAWAEEQNRRSELAWAKHLEEVDALRTRVASLTNAIMDLVPMDYAGATVEEKLREYVQDLRKRASEPYQTREFEALVRDKSVAYQKAAAAVRAQAKAEARVAELKEKLRRVMGPQSRAGEGGGHA